MKKQNLVLEIQRMVISYASDYITNKRKKCVKKCVDRRKAVNTANLRVWFGYY